MKLIIVNSLIINKTAVFQPSKKNEIIRIATTKKPPIDLVRPLKYPLVFAPK